MDMMASQTPNDRGSEAGAPDPSMQDILASIRRILSEDEEAAPVSATTPPRMTSADEPAPKDDILDLDAGLMVNDMTAHPPELAGPVTQTPPSEAAPGMIAPEAAQAAASSMTQLMRGIAQNRMASVSRNGPSLEDLVRDEIRPILKDWLDTHLPPMVERLVRTELERLSARVRS
jgi:uncharacterized protein